MLQEESGRKRKSRWGDVTESVPPPLTPQPPVPATYATQYSQGVTATLPLSQRGQEVQFAPPPPPPPPSTHVVPAFLPPPSSLAGPPPGIASIVSALSAKSGGIVQQGANVVTGSSNTTTPAPVSCAPPGATQDMNSRLYVGSIPFDITQGQIEALFSPFGHILKIDWSVNENVPLLSKGYCFIWYADSVSANAAMEVMNSFEFDGRAIKVSRPSGSTNAIASVPSIKPVKVTSAAEALAAALGTLPVTQANPSTTTATITPITTANTPTTAIGELVDTLQSFALIQSCYLKIKNIPDLFTITDIQLLFESFGVVEVLRIPLSAMETTILSMSLGHTAGTSAAPLVMPLYWHAQVSLRDRAATLDMLYTMNNNIGPFNYYLSSLYKEMQSIGSRNAAALDEQFDMDHDRQNLQGDMHAIGDSKNPNMTGGMDTINHVKFLMTFEYLAIPVIPGISKIVSDIKTIAAVGKSVVPDAAVSAQNSAPLPTQSETSIPENLSKNPMSGITTDTYTAVWLQHMVTIDDMADPELTSDIAEEASAFGKLIECLITMQSNTSTTASTKINSLTAHVYLHYSSHFEACQARDSMHGKFFGDNSLRVEAILVSMEEFQLRKKQHLQSQQDKHNHVMTKNQDFVMDMD